MWIYISRHTQLNGRAEIKYHAFKTPLTHILPVTVCVHVHIYEKSYLCIFHLFVSVSKPSQNEDVNCRKHFYGTWRLGTLTQMMHKKCVRGQKKLV